MGGRDIVEAAESLHMFPFEGTLPRFYAIGSVARPKEGCADITLCLLGSFSQCLEFCAQLQRDRPCLISDG
ncbi:hypothetical protein GCM10022223_12580 [Kineosporia mesophila]|uniref:Uncharacterized protein n=1 Tax=Kineosporia mesophila TaxID=566012 RepID=A0ABP6Z730_9ACTN